MENKTPKYHPKAAFALFLNQAEHNVEKALKEVTKRKDDFNNSKQVKSCIENLSFEQMYKLENKYFNFLRINYNNQESYKFFSDFIDTETKEIEKEEEKQAKILEIKRQILLFSFQRLDDFRNFYSHFFHKTNNAQGENIFEIKFGSDQDKYLRKFLKTRFEDAKDFYLNFIHQMPEGFKNKYEPKHLLHLNIENKKSKDYKNYQFFNFKETNNNFYFDNGERKHKRRNYKSTVFLASFFLSKRQINLFISQIKGFKYSAEPKAQATREVFTHFCMKTDSDFKSENTDVRFFTDAFTHLSKVPRLAIENFKDENIEVKITHKNLNDTKNIIFIENKLDTDNKNAKEKAIKRLQEIQEKFNKLDIIKDKKFDSVTQAKKRIDEIIKNDVEKIIGSKKYENYKDILIDFALKDVKIRTSKDRFSEFALQFIDDFELFDKIRFKVYSGRVFEIQHQKQYHNETKFDRTFIKPEKIYSRINEIEQTQLPAHCPLSLFKNSKSKKVENIEVIDDAQEPQYFIKNNNVFFEVETKYGKQKASMSVHELRNLAFTSLSQNKIVEDKIIKYLENYRELLDEILTEKNPSEITYDIQDKELPKYIVKYLKQQNTSIEDYKTLILNRLKFINENTENQKTKIKTLRKYDKVSEIVKFINRFNAELRGDKRGYLNVNQHQELEKLLGTFPKSEKELILFLNDNEITTNVSDFKSFLQSKPDLNSILYKVFGIYISWTKKSIKKVKKSDDKDFLKSIARIINVTESDYSFERIKQNIEKFLNENIVIPRGFIKQNFFGGKGLSNIIDKKATDKEACIYCDKLKDVYKIAQNATENKREKYKIAKTLNETRLKDKVLFLMAKKYLEEKITGGKAKNIQVNNEIGNILKDGIEIKKKIDGNYKIIKFGINEFDRMPTILNDKRLDKIISNYLPHLEKIELINREKYEQKKSIIEKPWDLQDAFQKINDEQLQVVDAILKKEEEILFEYLSKEAEKIGILPRYVERYINRTVIDKVLNKQEFEKFANKGRYKDNENYKYAEKLDKLIEPLLKDGNRIETKKIFQTTNFQIENLSQLDKIILTQDVKDEIFYSLIQKINFDSLLTKTNEKERKEEKKELIEEQSKKFKGEEKKDDIKINKNDYSEIKFKEIIQKLINNLTNEDLKNEINKITIYNYTNIVIHAIIIKFYRDKTFHNALPDSGTFTDGINLINHKRKMIEKIKIKNFKCFKEAELDFGKITLLTGANSSGKSSLIDAILSAMQTEKYPLVLDLNGKYKNIGGFEQVIHNTEGNFIDIEIDFTNINKTNDTWKIKTKWQKSSNFALHSLNSLNSEYVENNDKINLEISKSNDFNYNLKSVNFENNYQHIKDAKTDILEKGLLGSKEFPITLLDKNFNYIDSYREEPEELYKQSSAKSKIASNGKGYTQQIMEWEDTDIRKLGELIDILKKLKLLHSIKTKKQDGGNFKVFVKVNKNSIEVPIRNIGYGVSKILPILVADLQLENHSLLAVSEPEIDLHPSVQADFAEYLASQTKNNKQYIVETHSEYIINRLRLLISKGELKEEDVKVYFFENNGIETKTYDVKLKKNGQITDAPDSFFETYEVDTLNIALNSFENE